ncbi:hypothetical protein KIPB_011538, partial [Kipferlia bialata]|eukprot:g11538.t1
MTNVDSVERMRRRYLNSPLVVDIDYIALLTEFHKQGLGLPPVLLRGTSFGQAIGNLTPVIRDDEPFAGSQTKHVRGAIPFTNYASSYVLRELDDGLQERY